ncbi:T9SS type A sorting domain-containing protein [uncultured Lacinutrix sp.]|uniref:T9SS type A sorting domain-containing protein n=1 Tax=uncultured Lacinutrix sp. TaxID=574032 RepID=UPI002618D3BC|nr:T9SS type A sorting domain-containing protein [uncultured Lacinutrix sp.]
MKKITLLLTLLTFSFGFSQTPTTNAAAPTNDAADVISIYGSTYSNGVTNYDPNWGQSGHMQVNSAYDPGTGALILAYPNFNYQGTELAAVDASGMEYLHVDIWTAADPMATDIQVSPINNGTGTVETLVSIAYTSGTWTSVDIPIGDFTGMTWDSVFQMKFAANGAGSTVPVDIYLDNVYFWKTPTAPGTDATLSDLQVEMTTVTGFSSATENYAIELPIGTTAIPQITLATTTDALATVTTITQAAALPGDATVLVTAQDGITTKTYTVSFSVATVTAPTTNAAAPTNDAADVISIYGSTYSNGVTNYDPNWGQSGHMQVNSAYDPGTGALILAYPNFNYQGTELAAVDASGMEYLHVDIWTAADPMATDIQVSPINNGTGAVEALVSIAYTSGTWTSVDLPIGDFTGMTWDSIFQMKFAANGAGSTVPVDIYLDNVYFWKTPTAPGTDATLSDLQVEMTTVTGFSSATENYAIELPIGTTAIPQITLATTTDALATVTTITQAAALPGDATVLVTAQDGITTKTYTVSFSVATVTAPTTNAAAPTNDAADVISIYGSTYSNGVTNYDPNWGQSGHMQVNSAYDPGTGALILAYPNFNYQGTELAAVDASGMEYLHVDIWTAADPMATDIQVSPINNGTGTVETLVSIAYASGTWTSVDLPIGDFTGMTWDSIFQMKFAANGAGSTVPVDIYLDNVYFWKSSTLGTEEFSVDTFNVFPNPTGSNWTIKSNNTIINTIEIFDTLGKKVLSIKPNVDKVDVDASNLNSGLYFARIATNKGINTIKLVKE